MYFPQSCFQNAVDGKVEKWWGQATVTVCPLYANPLRGQKSLFNNKKNQEQPWYQQTQHLLVFRKYDSARTFSGEWRFYSRTFSNFVWFDEVLRLYFVDSFFMNHPFIPTKTTEVLMNTSALQICFALLVSNDMGFIYWDPSIHYMLLVFS